MSNRAKELKPLFLKTSFLLLNFSLLFTLCGCFPILKDYTINEYGYFQYIIIGSNSTFRNEEDESIAIVGFTDSGKEQETLDIPKEIDGHLVKRIGLRDEGFTHNSSHKVFPSDKLKKMYIFESIERIDYFAGSNVDIVICSETLNFYLPLRNSDYKNLFLYNPLFKNLGSPNSCKPANINFMNNYPLEDKGGLYRLDNIEASENIPEPLAPKMDGYEFTGWHTEPECINEWDFEVVPTIEENEDFTLFAGWQPL